MAKKLTVVFDDFVMDWLRNFASARDMSMGEVVRIETEALMQNDLAAKAAAMLERPASPERVR